MITNRNGDKGVLRVGGVECFRQVWEASTARDVRLNLHRQRMRVTWPADPRLLARLSVSAALLRRRATAR